MEVEYSDDMVDLFRRMPNFATFDQVDDPIAAMMWINQLEHMFRVFKCPDEHKALYAVTMLKSRALVWWGLVQFSRGSETASKMTWNDFKEVFKERFCPVSMEMALVEQLMNLKQGINQPLEEYIARFEELWWFFSCYLTPEKRLIYRFVWGLRDDIKRYITPSDMITFEKVVQAALAVENENNRRLEARNNCNRKGKKGKCYNCGELGHMARECPST